MITMILDNNIENIKVYDDSGVDRIFIDLEINGKHERQGHLDTVISKHSKDDVKRIKPILKNSQLLVRVNPIYKDSEHEIQSVIDNGADIVMLPMFKNAEEVEDFVSFINKQAKVCLLLETSQALARIDDILEVKGIDEIHIGLNDLYLSLGLSFLFEPLVDGIVEYLANKIKAKDIPFGIGGVALMDEGDFNGKVIIKEHVRLGSGMVILSRTFKKQVGISKDIFQNEISKIHKEVAIAKQETLESLLANKRLVKSFVDEIVKEKLKNV